MVVSTNNVFYKKSIVKEGGEIMKKIHSEIKNFLVPGAFGKQIDQIVKQLHIKYGVKNTPAESYNYPGHCCISINDCLCHGCPNNYSFKHGDIVSVDIFFEYKEYCIDCCRTYLILDSKILISASNRRDLKLIEYNIELLESSIQHANNMLAEGYEIPYSIFGNTIYKTIRNSPYCVSHEYGGHSIDKKIHSGLFISSSANSETTLIKDGDTFCVEPIISYSKNGEIHIETYIENSWNVKNISKLKTSHWENTYIMDENKIISIT